MEYQYSFFIAVSTALLFVWSKSIWLSLFGISIITYYLPSGLRLIGGISPISIIVYFFTLMLIYYTIKKNSILNSAFYNRYKTFFLKVACILITLSILSTSLDFWTQLTYIKFQLFTLAMPLFIFAFLNRERDLDKIKIVFIIAILISGIYSLYCYSTSSNPFGTIVNINSSGRGISEGFIDEIRGGLKSRVQGFTNHPLVFASISLSSFYFILQFYLLNEKKGFCKYVYWAVLCFCLLCIFITGSRSGVISIFIGMLYFLYKRYGKVFVLYLTVVFLVFYINGTFFIKDDYIRSIIFFWENNTNISGSSYGMRLDQLDATLVLIGKDFRSLFFGLGNNWCEEYAQTYGMHPQLLGFESILFSGLINWGVLGFIGYYGLMYMFFFFMNKRFVSHERIKILLNSYLISSLCYFIFTGSYAFSFFLITYSLMLKVYSVKNCC